MSHAFGHRRRSPIELRRMPARSRLDLDWISAGSRRDLGLISARSRPRASLSAHTARGAGRLNSHVIPTQLMINQADISWAQVALARQQQQPQQCARVQRRFVGREAVPSIIDH